MRSIRSKIEQTATNNQSTEGWLSPRLHPPEKLYGRHAKWKPSKTYWGSRGLDLPGIRDCGGGLAVSLNCRVLWLETCMHTCNAAYLLMVAIQWAREGSLSSLLGLVYGSDIVFEYIPVRQILLKWEFYVFLQYFWLLFRSFLVQADQSICQCTLQCTPCQLAFESADLDVYFSPANTQCLARDVFSFLLLSWCVSANIRGRPLFLCVLFPLSFTYAFHPFTFSYFSGEQGRVLVEKQMAYNWPDMGHIRPARMHARPYMQMSCYFPWFVCFSAFAISRYNAPHIFPTASQSLSGKSNVQWQLAKIRRTDGRTGIDWKLFCNFCDCPPGRFDFWFFFPRTNCGQSNDESRR